jgi:hypothetical protein
VIFKYVCHIPLLAATSQITTPSQSELILNWKCTLKPRLHCSDTRQATYGHHTQDITIDSLAVTTSWKTNNFTSIPETAVVECMYYSSLHAPSDLSKSKWIAIK